MGQKQTRTGARRSGDDYQDLVAAKTLLGLLRHPSRYRWVKFEAREAGKLDDVLVLRADGIVEATQVKYSTDALRPGDSWNWATLLEQDRGRSSLIQKWCESVVRLDETYGGSEPRLVSNRRAGDDLLLTSSGLVDTDRTDPDVLESIRSQLGEHTDNFLERFRFDLDEQDLPDFEENLLRQFKASGLSEANWLSFKDSIRSWIRNEGLPKAGEIGIADVRAACGWHQLSPLPQYLEIPDDYTLPHQDFHDAFLERVEHDDEATIVLTAGPGVGKSTYLSYLVEGLRDLGRPVVRHHYSLQAGIDRWERLESRRIAESLMANIEVELAPYLDGLVSQNPNPDALRDWLCEVGSQLKSEGRCLVVVIDGLDHVWRMTESHIELRKLFDHLIPVPVGITLVVGTQPVEDRQLPPSLLQVTPRDRWIQLPRLDEQAIKEWLGHYSDLMPAEWLKSDRDRFLFDLASSLLQRTAGHPLLLRYSVQRIASRGDLLTRVAIEAIPETPADSVEEYYRALWLGLRLEARDVVLLLTIGRFSWPEGSLYECLRVVGYEQASSLAAVDSVRHLLGRSALGLSPFHSSLLSFATQQPEFHVRAAALRAATIEWLKDQAPQNLRRSHLWLLQQDAGDSEPLMKGSNRRWLLGALADGHPLDELGRILRAAAWEAIAQADYRTYVDRGVLADALRAGEDQEEALRWSFAAQLSLGGDEFIESHATAGLDELDDPKVLTLARHLHNQERREETAKCFREISGRSTKRPSAVYWGDGRSQRYEVLSELAGLAGVEPERFTAFVEQFESEDLKARIAESWTAGLRRSADVRSAIQALHEEISGPVRRCLSRYVAVQAASERVSLTEAERQLLDPPYAWVYQLACESGPDAVPPEEPIPPQAATDLPYGEFSRDVGRYIHDLFFFLVIRELQMTGYIADWTPPESLRPWLRSALMDIAQGANDVAARWRDTGSISVTAGYDFTRTLKSPPWRNGTVDRESGDGVRRALRTTIEDLLVLRSAIGGIGKLSWSETETIGTHRFAGFTGLLGWIAEGSVGIERGSIGSLCKSLDDELGATIEPFSERASTFSLMAAICAQYRFGEEARHYLLRSSENLIGYGYRKDVLLNTALSAVEAGVEHFDERAPLWLGLAPAIASIREFTDGAETSHLPARLGKLMLRIDQSLGIAYVQSLMDDEQYSDVEEILHNLVDTGDLDDPVVRALVSTCIEPRSIRRLERRAAEEGASAKRILDLKPSFSSRLASTDSPSVNSEFSEAILETSSESRGPDTYLAYPPERLDQFVRLDTHDRPDTRADELCAWFCQWASTERAADALNAVEPYFLEDDRLQVSNQAVVAVAGVVGRTRSYLWLVRAQRSNNGWSDFWTDLEEAKERWRLVRQHFPDCWHDFVAKSIRPPAWLTPYFGGTISRLVEYLIYFGRSVDAYAATYQLVQTIGDLVSGQELPNPHWIRSLGGDT